MINARLTLLYLMQCLYLLRYYCIFMPRGGATAYGSSIVCLFVIMPRAELRRHTVVVLSVCHSVCLSVCYKHFSSRTEVLRAETSWIQIRANIDICLWLLVFKLLIFSERREMLRNRQTDMTEWQTDSTTTVCLRSWRPRTSLTNKQTIELHVTAVAPPLGINIQ